MHSTPLSPSIKTKQKKRSLGLFCGFSDLVFEGLVKSNKENTEVLFFKKYLILLLFFFLLCKRICIY